MSILHPEAKTPSSFAAIAALQLICAVFFAIDIGFELHDDLLADRPMRPVDRLHLIAEVVATLLLVVGFGLVLRELRRLRQQAQAANQSLQSLRGQFDDVLMAQFQVWGLSQAERDVALLSLRGLKIAEIASLRDTREGTIKSQLSAIFRKAGVSTRSELLALFMDEFLTHGAEGPAARPDRTASVAATGPRPPDRST